MDIFSGRLYTLPTNKQPNRADKTLIKKILEKNGYEIPLKNLELVKVGEDYDLYFIKTEDKLYSLKLSFDPDNKSLKREMSFIKKAKIKSAPTFVSGGNVVVGDKLFYLLCEAAPSESITDYGLGAISGQFDKFLEDYSELYNQSNNSYTFQKQTKDFVSSFNFQDLFGQDEIGYIQQSSDHKLCELIIATIQKEILNLCKNLDHTFQNTILGDVDLSYIFYDGVDFQFFDLKNSCVGHAFSDFINISLTLGLNKDAEKSLITKACSKLNIAYDQSLFELLHSIELRKKALKLFCNYLKEVYLYESQRIEELFKLAQEFTASYERYCKIPIVKENRQFIFKNITEPILEASPKE